MITKKKNAKKFVVALCAIVFLNMFVLVDNPFVYAASPDLFISEYIEGSSNNKAIELYNNTGSSVDLAAAGYSIRIYFNGNSTAGTTVNLTGTVGAGSTYVVVQSLAGPGLLALANQISTASWFNGDDAIVLMKGTTTIDRIGTIGVDPGTAWTGGGVSALDHTLVRNPNITQGDTSSADPFDPSVQWVQSPIDTFSNLGSHALTTFQVTFDLGLHGVVTSGNLVQTVNIGDNGISPTVQANEGYTFTGWDNTYNNVQANLTVTAQYTQNTYAVTFNTGEGAVFHSNGGAQNQQLHYGNVVVKPEDPTREGYTFDGWYADTNYTQKYVFGEGIQGDLVLYAKWIESKNQGFPYQNSPSQGFPETGDDSNLMLWFILCCIGSTGLGIQYRNLRKS